MRRSEFDRAMSDEFGSRAPTILVDLVLSQVGFRTAADALAAGVPAREVWLAVCEEADVPVSRRYGVGQREPRR